MGLDARGDIAIVQIVFYIPVLAASAIITFRHGFTRKEGWILLLILALSKYRNFPLFLVLNSILPL